MPRKPSLEPSIRQRGNRYEAARTVEGRREYIYGETREEVKKKLAKLFLKSKPVRSNTLTVNQYLVSYLESQERRVQSGELSPNTYITRRSNLSNHVLPGLGHIRLQSLDRRMVHEYFDALGADKTKGSRAVQLAFESLRTALNEAVDPLGYIDVNPCAAPPGSKRSIKPHHSKAAREFLTMPQITSLLEISKGRNPKYLYPLLLVAVTTGMRQGEVFALKWEDVDFVEGTVHIHRSITSDIDGGLREKSTKGTVEWTSDRTIKVPPLMLEVLLPLRGEGLLFPNSHGVGPLSRSNFMADHFRPLLADSGVPSVDFYSLRHSHASLLISSGVNIKKISNRLGHKSIQITLDTYGHLLPDDEEDVVEVFERGLRIRGAAPLTGV